MIVKRDIRAAYRRLYLYKNQVAKRRISITLQFYSQPPATGSKTAKILCVAVVFLAEGFITSNNNHKKGNDVLLALMKQLCDTNEIHASSVLKIRYAEMESIRVYLLLSLLQ
ncbi:uncharacterized protein LOC133709862 [Rosa rugosa]|uniref:uncharacterized protein LOC133709862 n=1 Tax=Rosa rugosa TaxID=74645 RepID=UPI002B416C06|nr:uncharacterized protein LOC133709862 [Rosa rugosa]XP_061991777.1 uncharacterized protein LOC133709862 [Rosa rugosa]XP_061991778.1 uncharacterized protein LOC133709862 [Rosa rugosa]XP_061991779.1 uncharacterized protein LOC133709862 [Rosa rugosa]